MKKITDHKGNEFNSIKELAKYYDIDYDILRRRLTMGYSVSMAVDKDFIKKYSKKLPKTPFYKEGDKKYYSLAELVRDKNLNYSTTLARLRAGWSVKKAIETPVVPKKPRKPVKKTFLMWLCEKLGN